MKRYIMLTLWALCAALPLLAVPALPYPQKVMQPDGSTMTVQMHGDEWYNFASTADGYTLVQNAAGYWVYARVEGDELVPTATVAHDAQRRTAAEQRLIAQIGPHALPAQSAISARRAARMAPARKLSGKWDISRFRGLVILLNYTDRKFQQPSVFEPMMNQEGYTGYQDSTSNTWVECTGSVHDYFKDNSNGHFAPQFDVYGPVDVPYSQTYINQYNNAGTVFRAALTALDGQVDYSRYDTDGDGTVDMVFFIVPGGGSNAGNNSRYLWPHASTLNSVRLDGVNFGRYACSTELNGLERDLRIDGIGTIAHEFSHVLGLPDLYDVNYATNGYSTTPGEWDIMAGANYLNYSRTPAGYGLFERWSMGWANPQVVSSKGQKRVYPLQTSNSGYRVNSAISEEYFLIENRKNVRWDACLPGEGLVVWRVDSTDESAWTSNRVNINPTHNYFELVRAARRDTTFASGSSQYTLAVDGPWDAFPGVAGVDSLTNQDAAPNIKSWTGLTTDWMLTQIKGGDEYMTFSAKRYPNHSYLEPFESMPLTSGADTTGLPGTFAHWSLTKGIIAQPDSGWCNGSRAAGLLRNGDLRTTDEISYPMKTVKFSVFNPTATAAIVRCYFSANKGVTWTNATTYTGSSLLRVATGEKADAEFRIGSTQPVLLRFYIFSGSSTDYTYIDDIKVDYESSESLDRPGDVNGDGQVNTTDVTDLVNAIINGSDDIETFDVTGDGQLNTTDVTALVSLMLNQ